MSRQTSRLLQLCFLLAVASIANAASVASRISQHAKVNHASTGALTKALREAATAARAAPVAAERRGLAESDFNMCDFLGDNIKCAVSQTSSSCGSKPGCEWYAGECTHAMTDAETQSMFAAVLPLMTQSFVCQSVSDLSTCAGTSNCEANAACNPSEAYVEAQFPDDALMSAMMHQTLKCSAIPSASTCDAQDDCEWYDGSCELSEDATASVMSSALLECDFDESIADGASAVVADNVDLCPVAKAQIECAQIAAESACDGAAKCEWLDPDDSDDPHDTRYPCVAKDEHMEPMFEVLEANLAVSLRAYGECANEYNSESACERDEECTWNGASCEANDLKLFRALGNAHPHFARYYQIDATCSAFERSACGSGGSAGKCVWSEASVGGDAAYLPTVKTFAQFMSCECPAEIAAAAPSVDTSSADCSDPEIPGWFDEDDTGGAASRETGSAFFTAAAAVALAALA